MRAIAKGSGTIGSFRLGVMALALAGLGAQAVLAQDDSFPILFTNVNLLAQVGLLVLHLGLGERGQLPLGANHGGEEI